MVSGKRALEGAAVLLGLWFFYYLWTGTDRARARIAVETSVTPPAAINAAPPSLAASPKEAARLPPLAASDLLEAYRANEIKADLLYKGKRFHVTGAVTRIRSDIADEPQVELVRDVMGVTARGLSKEFAASLNKGDSFEGDCTVVGSIVGSPIVDCG
jgi:hypothetical protein